MTLNTILNARAAFLVTLDGEVHDPVADATPTKVVAVTPEDEYDEEEPPAPTGNAAPIAGGPYRALSIAGAGTIHVQFMDGSDAIIPSGSLAVGIQHLLWFVGIYDTDTSATGILAWR